MNVQIDNVIHRTFELEKRVAILRARVETLLGGSTAGWENHDEGEKEKPPLTGAQGQWGQEPGRAKGRSPTKGHPSKLLELGSGSQYEIAEPWKGGHRDYTGQ